MPEQRGDAASRIAREWRPLADLPEDWRDLRREDLRAVHQQWMEDRSHIKDETKVRKFQGELSLRWAIETGIIERLYTVERGVTVQILKAGMEALGRFHARGHISADARALIADQRQALEMVMDLVGGTRSLTDSYIKALHHRLTLSQEECEAEDPEGNLIKVPLRKGEWKKQSNNPRRRDGSVHQYCPPEFVQDEIDKLLAWHRTHADISPEVEAAWLHHRFTQIHPFQDGNGRVARALTGAVFLKAGYLVLVIRDQEHRELYLDALESADSGDLGPLVDLFAEIQIGDLNEAIKSVRELRGETMIKVSESLAERARRRQAASREQAADAMNSLIQIASTRLDEAKAELERAFEQQGVRVDSHHVVDGPEQEKMSWWSWQIAKAAREDDYFADLIRPRRWVALSLSLPDIGTEVTRFVVSLHAVGRAAGLHAATAFLTTPVESGEGSRPGRWHSDTVSERRFRFGAGTEKLEEAEKRFRSWLDPTIENGLSMWGERL